MQWRDREMEKKIRSTEQIVLNPFDGTDSRAVVEKVTHSPSLFTLPPRKRDGAVRRIWKEAQQQGR